jgi:hypothetical protein
MFQYNNIFSSDPIENFWEGDYLNSILEPYKNKNIKILIYSENTKDKNSVLNFKINFKPDLIFHISDEWGNWHWQKLMYENVPLVFRQYMFKQYPKLSNVYQIPLGYMSNYLKLKKPIKQIKDRENFWGFCGNIESKEWHISKNKIKEQISKFPHEHIFRTDPENMFDVYNNSVFMPNRRGNYSLDCLRIYEACMVGCIPIIEGSPDELTGSFSFNLNNDKIPFVFIENYENSVDKIEKLYNDKYKLQEISDSCIEWFYHQMDSIHFKIKEIHKNIN